MTTAGLADVPARVRTLVAASRADVEVVDVVVASGVVRVLVDHPDGVTHGLCEELTRDLAPLRESYALEVSSPGLNRPLVSERDYERAIGKDVDVRLRELQDGRRRLRGRLAAFDDGLLTVALDDGGSVTAPLTGVARAKIRWKPETI